MSLPKFILLAAVSLVLALFIQHLVVFVAYTVLRLLYLGALCAVIFLVLAIAARKLG